MRVGFIGTGSMGKPVARNLLSECDEMFVHDADPTATVELLEAGAIWCENPAAVGAQADIILLSLPSHAEVEQVCFAGNGLLGTVRPGTFLIDLTTVSVSLIPRLVAAQQTHGIRYLTSPVSQGVDNAAIGNLSVFVGGDAADLEQCRPLFTAMASVVLHTGDHFSAMAAKLATNLLWFVNAAAIGEALVLGAKSGIEPQVLRQVLLNSCGTSWVAEHDLQAILDGTYDPSFTTQLCRKDLRLIMELADHLDVPIEIGAMVQDIFARTEDQYGPKSPELSVVRMLLERTGTTLQARP